MIPKLTIDDFEEFFYGVNDHSPFPWQKLLAEQVAKQSRWPGVLDLPTGFGKTAALDVAVFHLAMEADRGAERRAPLRIAFVVDRRLVVDDSFKRAGRITLRLKSAQPETVIWRVAERLRSLAGAGNPPLLARRLRGGLPREDDWARTPSQPTILCSTVDQVGSRLLFRGYGISDSMKPVHAGLMGTDCLILLDEAHLSEPFRQTLGWVEGYRSERWREKKYAAPWGATLLTATAGSEAGSRFCATEADYADPILKPRWEAKKPASLVDLSKRKRSGKKEAETDDQETSAFREKQRVDEVSNHALDALKHLRKQNPSSKPAIAVVVNRVARARAVFDRLKGILRECTNGDPIPELTLLIGPARPIDRNNRAVELDPIRTGAVRNLAKPLVLVATQCIEAGVDIDLDGIVTEAAPVDSLRQRFGRLNRAGREFVPYGAIVGHPKDDKDDPIYGKAIVETWKYLERVGKTTGGKKSEVQANFGLKAFAEKAREHPPCMEMLASKLNAPVLLPAYLDLLAQTAPIPNADPEVSLYLHGPNRSADAVTVVWREDAEPGADTDTRTLLLLVPPRSAEAIELPVWTVRRWLTRTGPISSDFSELADVPGPISDEPERCGGRKAFRWRGDDEKSRWIEPNAIRPGDTIVVPASYGGADQYGWNPHLEESVIDVAEKAAEPFEGRRLAVRVAPQLFDNDAARNRLSEIVSGARSSRWRELRDALLGIVRAERERLEYGPARPSKASAARIERLDAVAGALERFEPRQGKVQLYTGVYGTDGDGSPLGIVFVAPFGIKAKTQSDDLDSSSTTEDDLAGSLPGYAQPLEEHSKAVEQKAGQFAEQAGLPRHRVDDLKVAAYLHDAGKADRRFQTWLAYGDPLGPDPEKLSKILAKSGRQLPRDARKHSGLPKKWRHEAFSVRLAPYTSRFEDADDKDLVLWLIGTHHGQGRPFFPHADPADAEMRTDLPAVLGIPQTLPSGVGPQSLAFDRDRLDWPSLYERLKTRYGVWELARMEAVLRLADHRASDEAKRRKAHEQEGSR